MKVLIISSMYPNKYSPYSGIFIHTQAKYLQRAGCSLRVIAPVPFSPKALWFKSKWRNYGQLPSFGLLEGIPVYYLRYINLPGSWFHGPSCYTMYPNTLWSLDAIIRDFKPDIVHAHMATPDGYVGLKISRRHRLPFVCSLRGGDINTYPYRDRLTMALTRKVIARAHKVVSVSGALRSAAEKICQVNKKIHVVYNGCDNELFSPNAESRIIFRKKLGIGQEKKVLIFAGLINECKGIHELMEAFFALSGQFPDLNLILVGEGSARRHIETMAVSRNMLGRVHVIGNQKHSEMPKWLNTADLFVLPSHSEGLPNVILEAMGCNLPVVATKVGGIPEAVADWESGILIAKQDTHALTGAIKYLIENQTVAGKMGKYGGRILKSRFSWEVNAKKTIEIYREVL